MLTDSCTLRNSFIKQRCPDVRAGQVFGLYASCVCGWMLNKECACFSHEKS